MKTRNTYNLGTFASTGNSIMVKTGSFRNSTVTIVSTGTVSLSVQMLASNSEQEGTTPDLSVAAASSNKYTPVQVINLDTGVKIDGATGIALTAAGVTRYEVNDNNNTFIGCKVTITSGSAEVILDSTDNQ